MNALDVGNLQEWSSSECLRRRFLIRSFFRWRSRIPRTYRSSRWTFAFRRLRGRRRERRSPSPTTAGLSSATSRSGRPSLTRSIGRRSSTGRCEATSLKSIVFSDPFGFLLCSEGVSIRRIPTIDLSIGLLLFDTYINTENYFLWLAR